MAELRLETGAALIGGGSCALPQNSLLAPPGVRCSSDRLPDAEQGLRVHRRRIHSRAAARRARIPVVQASKSSAGSDDEDAQMGTKKLFNLPGTLKIRKKDTNVVFVAGATGNVGSRTVRELIKSGLRVRAGVRSMDKAESVLGETITSISSSSPLAKVLAFFGVKQQEQLEIVDCDLEKLDDIESALGNAGVVICAIGASEKEVLDVTGPYRIDYEATKNLITAAKNAEVKHFVLVTSLGTTKFGLPASALNLFWGVLIWKAKAEKALVDSGLPYTIVRPGGMERPTDSFKETHNLRLGSKDAFFGGQVSRLQVAELLACIANNLDLAEDKILEAIAETTAPLRSIEELLAEIPPQSSKEEPVSDEAAEKRRKAESKSDRTKQQDEEKRKAVEAKKAQEKVAKQKAQEEEAKRKAIEARKAQEEAKQKAAEAKKLQELRQKVARELSDLKQEEKVATTELESLQRKRIELSEKAQEAAIAAAKAEAVAKAVLVAANEGKMLTENDKRKILEAESRKAVQPPKITASKTTTLEPKKVSTTKEPVLKPKVAVEAKTVSKTETAKKLSSMKSTESEQSANQLQSKGSMKSDRETDARAKVDVEKTKKSPPNIQAKEPEKEETEAQPFRWFWEPDEKSGTAEARIAPSETTLSPSLQNPELKSSVVQSSEPPLAPALATSPSLEPGQILDTVDETAESAREREEAAVLKAKSSVTFRWPWQDESVETSSVEAPEEDTKVNETAVTDQTLSRTIQEEKADDTKPAEAITETSDILSVVQDEPNTAPKVIPDNQSPSSVEGSNIVISEEKKDGEGLNAAVTEADEYDSEDVKSREQEFLAKAKAASVFVWPWQGTSAVKEKIDVETAKLDTPAPAPAPAPTSPSDSLQSPYSTYPGWKPPSSPTPQPPETEEKPVEVCSEEPAKAPATVVDTPEVTSKVEVEAKSAPETATVEEKKELEDFKQTVDLEDVKKREQESLSKAKAATVFVWPWQGTPAVEVETPKLAKGETPRPSPYVLSPYSMYPDWKPPSSPTPRPPKTEGKPAVTSSGKTQGKSSVGVSSEKTKEKPIVVASKKSEEKPAIVSSGEEEEDFTSEIVKEREKDALEKARAALSWRWDFKTETINSEPTSASSLAPVSRPLSPYFRYEDLKPPSSPMPSPPKVETATNVDESHKTSQTSSASAGDSLPSDMVDEAAEEAKARAAEALEKAKASAAVKWPWV